jgi:DNA-binding ferritin-like protein (Dps family)
MRNPDRCLFKETEPVYKVINYAMLNIGKVGFYDAIFTDEYEQLEEDEKNMACGVVMAETGVSIKEFVDTILNDKSK